MFVKLLREILIRNRVNEELERDGAKGLAHNQFGFRKGRSILQAVQQVIDTAMMNNKKKWGALVTLDVKNAFNTATWSLIVDKLRRRGIQQYLVNLIEDYLDDRMIIVNRNE
mgnify:FL=1